MAKAKVTKDTKLSDIMGMPGGEKLLQKYNTPCLSCPISQYEMGQLKLGDVAGTYGLDMKSMLAELNKASAGKGARKRSARRKPSGK
jgi:hypothetical protein